MPETLLDVHKHEDVEGDEWYDALPPHHSGAAYWLQLIGLGLGVVANGISVGVLSCGLVGRWKKRRAMKNMSPEQQMVAQHPLYEVLRNTQKTAEQIQADVRQMLARADAIAAEQQRQRPDVK